MEHQASASAARSVLEGLIVTHENPFRTQGAEPRINIYEQDGNVDYNNNIPGEAIEGEAMEVEAREDEGQGMEETQLRHWYQVIMERDARVTFELIGNEVRLTITADWDERCHQESWEPDAPICNKCGRKPDTPGTWIYAAIIKPLRTLRNYKNIKDYDRQKHDLASEKGGTAEIYTMLREAGIAREEISELAPGRQPSSSRDHQHDTRHHQPGVAVTDGQATAAQQQHNSSLAATTCTSIKISSADTGKRTRMTLDLANEKAVQPRCTQCYATLMDLAKFNTMARNRFPTSVKPAELERNVDHMITSLRIARTRYGDKVIADLEYADIGKKTMFLPQHPSDILQKNVDKNQASASAGESVPEQVLELELEINLFRIPAAGPPENDHEKTSDEETNNNETSDENSKEDSTKDGRRNNDPTGT
ncbi:unnamed protein product [Trichogramma brassicae]|uniref:Uncharacterized protein n=1 Tax=Trichogramma brassicae TaxID=86971 RepID=A0A6H5IDF6_9HYME|nr:unnamed protein product [Trichogramma brassicae]